MKITRRPALSRCAAASCIWTGFAQAQPAIPGVISATRGNHGQSIAFAAARAGVPATIYVPLGNSPDQNSAITAFGARLVEFGRDFDEAKQEAFRVAALEGLHFVPSFIGILSPASPVMRWSCFAAGANWTPCMWGSAWARESAG